VRPVAGTIQLIDATIANGAEVPHLFGAGWLHPATEPERERREAEVRRQLQHHSADGRRLLALCGIITGIFDFEQIDGGEALDTLAPTQADHDAFARIDRRTLLQISGEDRSLNTVLTTVGISPYLIIPHALLIFDDHLARRAKSAADRVQREPEPTLEMLESTREEMNHNLRGLWLSNVFNYGTERALFSAGQEIRGTNDRHASLLSRLAEVEGSLRQEWERRGQRNQAMIGLLLAIVSIVSFKEPLSNTLSWLFSSKHQPLRMETSVELIVLVALIAIAAFAYLPAIRGLRRRRKLARERRA
jgi:hypothetical protein